MSILDGTPVAAATPNAGFMDKNQDTFTTGKVDLLNTASASITDLQTVVNTALSDILSNASDISDNVSDIASVLADLNLHKVTNTTHGTTSAIVGVSDAQTLTDKTINASANTITNLGNASIAASAAIELSKLATVTADRVLVSDSSGVVSAAGITATELSYLSGLATNVETALSASSSHIADTSNPHLVTPAQVGNGTAQWNANKLQGVNVSSTSPTDGQVLTYSSSGSEWLPAADGSGGGGGFVALTGQGLSTGGTISTTDTNAFELIPVQGATGAVTLSNTPFGTGAFTSGRVRAICCISDTNTVTIPHYNSPDGCINNGIVTLKNQNIVVYMYVGAVSRWLMLYKNF